MARSNQASIDWCAHWQFLAAKIGVIAISFSMKDENLLIGWLDALFYN